MFEDEMEFAEYVDSLGGVAYLVGGAVRDAIIGRPVNDRDYVVTGVHQGKIQEWVSAGKSFPVYLLKIGGYACEVALARRERKTSPGHCGFDLESDAGVTIEQDLSRRDFTMNAIAQNILTDEVVSISSGIEDLKNGVIRANTGAFAEDPLRVLRAARFAAQHRFVIHPDTVDLMRGNAENLCELSAERVFGELVKALTGAQPSLFFEYLDSAECLGWFPELIELKGVQAGPRSCKHGCDSAFTHTLKTVDRCRSDNPEYKFACLCHDFGKALSENPPAHHGHETVGLPLVENFCDRLRVPNAYRKAAMCFTKNHMRAHRLLEMRTGKAARLVCSIDREFPGEIDDFLLCSMADGMLFDYASDIYRRAKRVLAVRLPKKHHGKGAICSEIMTGLRSTAWKGGDEHVLYR